MKLARGTIGFADAHLIEGDEEHRKCEGERLRNERAIRAALKADAEEIARSDLTLYAGGLFLVHAPTGRFFRVFHGEIGDARGQSPDAFYIERDGSATFLNPPDSGPKTLAELEAHRAARGES